MTAIKSEAIKKLSNGLGSMPAFALAAAQRHVPPAARMKYRKF